MPGVHHALSEDGPARLRDAHDPLHPVEEARESKSLKLYLFGFRNHGDFHEDVVNVIYDDIWKLLRPKYLEVYGKFAARGGITIDPFVNGGAGTSYRALARSRFETWQGVRN